MQSTEQAYTNRILLISPLPPPAGGDSTWAEKYLQYREAQGWESAVVNTSLLGKRAQTVSDKKNLLEEFKRCRGIWKHIREKLKTFQPCVVHMNMNCSPFGVLRDYISVRIIKKRKQKLVIHCHCNVRDQIGGSKIGVSVLKRILKMTDAVIVLNTQSREYVRAISGKEAVIVPNFIEGSFVRDQKAISASVQTVLFTGHIRQTKGVSELLAVAKQHPDIAFLLAGTITTDYDKDELLRDSCGNVQLLGNVSPDEVRRLLDMADVFMFPSYTEGFSVSLLEAMARGVPIVTTAVGAGEEMLEHKGGVIVPPQDAQALSAALDSLDQAKRADMSRWNLEKVSHSYTIDRVMCELNRIYEEVYVKANM